MSNNQIAELIAAHTELKTVYENKRTEIAQEITRLGGVVDDHIRDIEEVSTVFLNHIFNVYVDQDADGDETGTANDPFTNIIDALNHVRNNRRGWAVIHLRAGQDHAITEFVHITLAYLQIQTWDNVSTPFQIYAEDSNANIEGQFATLSNQALPNDDGTYGILAAHPCRIFFRNLVVTTPTLLNEDSQSLNTGIVNRRDFFGKGQFVSNHCFYDLGSPLIRTSSGHGSFDIEMHAIYFKLDRMESAPHRVHQFIYANALNRSVEMHLSAVRNVDENPVGWNQRMFLTRLFTSGDPSVQPCNILSNTNFSASAVPII